MSLTTSLWDFLLLGRVVEENLSYLLHCPDRSKVNIWVGLSGDEKPLMEMERLLRAWPFSLRCFKVNARHATGLVCMTSLLPCSSPFVLHCAYVRASINRTKWWSISLMLHLVIHTVPDRFSLWLLSRQTLSPSLSHMSPCCLLKE